MKLLYKFLIILLISLLIPSSVKAADYYVSTTGNDNNSGTINLPWRTLYYAGKQLKAGDTLYIRGGVFSNDHLYICSSCDGTQNSPIKITNYNQEEVIIDSNYASTLPILVEIYGDWINVSNITVTRSRGQGVFSSGAYNTFDNIYSHHNWAAGIILAGNYDTVQNSRAWYNSVENENGIMSVSWATGISCARYPDHCTIKNSTAWENWGEGISTFESTNSLLENNISYNNMLNFYVSDSKNTVLQRNIGYCTLGNIIKPNSEPNGYITTQTNIGIWDEMGVPLDSNGNINPNGTRYPSSNNKIINNFAMGCDRPMAIKTGSSTNNLYAYNTLINSVPAYDPAAIYFNSGTCSNCMFKNNLVIQEGSLPISKYWGTGMAFSNNLWSKEPLSSVKGSGDVYLNNDPNLISQLLTREGVFAPGELTANWFKLTSSSMAIDHAQTLPDVSQDYFGTARGNSPDIGGDEYVGGQPSNTPTLTPAPIMGDANGDGHVDEIDFNIWKLNYNQSLNGVTYGDFNNSGKVDGVDYILWLNNYGV